MLCAILIVAVDDGTTSAKKPDARGAGRQSGDANRASKLDRNQLVHAYTRGFLQALRVSVPARLDTIPVRATRGGQQEFERIAAEVRELLQVLTDDQTDLNEEASRVSGSIAKHHVSVGRGACEDCGQTQGRIVDGLCSSCRIGQGPPRVREPEDPYHDNAPDNAADDADD